MKDLQAAISSGNKRGNSRGVGLLLFFSFKQDTLSLIVTSLAFKIRH